MNHITQVKWHAKQKLVLEYILSGFYQQKKKKKKIIIMQSPLTYEGERLYIIPNNLYFKTTNAWKDNGYKVRKQR